jgi:catechol 2,3-dioxygenase-like lactoylglutathione lyase family enzyme
MPAATLQPPGVLETALYCSDLDAAERFYRDIIGLHLVSKQPGRHVFFRCGEGMLLLFNPDVTAEPVVQMAGPVVPRHGAHGPGHVAFRLPERDIERWRTHLATRVQLEAEVHWPQGGYSLYLRDPAGNSIELATAAVWGLDEPSVPGGA